jgi:hypothetical protein
VPAGCVISDASVVGLTMTSPVRLEPGALVEFDLILGARPIATMARVISCAEEAGGRHRVGLGFVAMAQVDRDTLADFLQAVGRDVIRVREPRR